MEMVGKYMYTNTSTKSEDAKEWYLKRSTVSWIHITFLVD